MHIDTNTQMLTVKFKSGSYLNSEKGYECK